MAATWVLGAGALGLYGAYRAEILRAVPSPEPVPNHAFVSPPRPSAPAEVWAVGDGTIVLSAAAGPGEVVLEVADEGTGFAPDLEDPRVRRDRPRPPARRLRGIQARRRSFAPTVHRHRRRTPVKDKLKGILIALAAVAALGIGGAAIAGAAGGGGDDQKTEKAITGSALDRASAVALKEVGEGKVTRPRPPTKRAPTRSKSPRPTAARSTSTSTSSSTCSTHPPTRRSQARRTPGRTPTRTSPVTRTRKVTATARRTTTDPWSRLGGGKVTSRRVAHGLAEDRDSLRAGPPPPPSSRASPHHSPGHPRRRPLATYRHPFRVLTRLSLPPQRAMGLFRRDFVTTRRAT